MGALAGKTAFVTGGASGLGEAIARAYVAEGAAVIVADIDAAAGEALAAEIGARFVALDVTQEASWAQAVAPFERIDVLVNNAGITTLGSIEEITLDQFRHELDIDVLGVFMGTQPARHIEAPPSTRNSAPVAKALASLARNTAMAAISSGLPRRLTGWTSTKL